MNCARNCENLFNFGKVMPNILVVPFFPDTVYITSFYCMVALFASGMCKDSVIFVNF